VRLSEGAADSVDDGVLAHEKQGGGTRRHLITHALDEVVADADVRHGADQGSGRGADRGTDQRDEEDQTEQESPKRTTESPRSGRAMQLARLRLLLVGRPADDGAVQHLNEGLLLQSFEGLERLSAPDGSAISTPSGLPFVSSHSKKSGLGWSLNFRRPCEVLRVENESFDLFELRLGQDSAVAKLGQLG
jgi:hypothetical protein